MNEYQVTFTAHHIINVTAENEDKAREEAEKLFDGQVNWDIMTEEVD